MGVVLIGLGALNEAGIQGAIFQVVSHGLISALLFFLVGVMYERTKTTEIPRLGAMAKAMPITAGFLLAGGMAALGLPGMSGFISEFMAFLGLFKEMACARCGWRAWDDLNGRVYAREGIGDHVRKRQTGLDRSPRFAPCGICAGDCLNRTDCADWCVPSHFERTTKDRIGYDHA